MKQKDELIYELIFSENKIFSIIVSDYIEDIYTYDTFIDDIKFILKKSKVLVVKESIIVSTDNVKWNLKVKK
jgi:hypothetical protein